MLRQLLGLRLFHAYVTFSKVILIMCLLACSYFFFFSNTLVSGFVVVYIITAQETRAQLELSLVIYSMINKCLPPFTRED